MFSMKSKVPKFGRARDIVPLANGDIYMCGEYQTTQGIIAKITASGTVSWALALHIPCVKAFVDDKETLLSIVIASIPSSLEVHQYNVTSGDKKYIFELQYRLASSTDLKAVNDGKNLEEFTYVLADTHSSGCSII